MPFMTEKPSIVVHADWSLHSAKRWMAWAEMATDSTYRVSLPQLVGALDGWFEKLVEAAGPASTVLVGFDFPIGLPLAYARQIGMNDFLSFLPHMGQGMWRDFYRVAERPAEIGLHRPFYPQRPGGTRQQHLLDGLGIDGIDDLRRQCELPRPFRRAAAPLFWTLGGQQVGKAAISGWRDLLAPAVRRARPPVVIWPFAGRVVELYRPGQVVVAETYPAEYYSHLGVTFARRPPGQRWGKRVQAARAANGSALLTWADDVGVSLSPELSAGIASGFGPGAQGEDQFDAVVGLFGMLNVVLGRLPAGGPPNEAVRRVEGWILGLGH